MKTQMIAGAVALAASAGLASAQFSVLIPGTSNSGGPLGDATNTVNVVTATGTSGLFSSVRLTGTLTEVNTGTWAGEANWAVRNATLGISGVVGASTNYTLDPFGTQQDFTGSIQADFTRNGLYWITNGDQLRHESFESFNDSGIDAAWTNAQFDYSGAVSGTNLGVLSATASIDTLGSIADTEIAIYTANGTLLALNDDNGGGGLWSLINANLSGSGTFYLVVSGFNSEFGNGFATAGTATGGFVLNVDGNEVASGTLAAGDMNVYTFTIPSPASAALLGLGGLVGLRRRR